MGTKRWGENACAKGVMGTKRNEEGDWGQKGKTDRSGFYNAAYSFGEST